MTPGGTPIEITYVDLVLIILAAVTVVVTALGVIIAVAAIWGMTGLRRAAHDISKATATEAVQRSLREGGELYKMAERTFENFTYRETGMGESSGASDPEEPKSAPARDEGIA